MVCFCSGTLYQTDRVAVPVERPSGALKDHPRLRPIRISAGALGEGLPAKALRVSPQYRIPVRSEIARSMFGAHEVLVAAKKLLGMPGIAVDICGAQVRYWHLILDRHEMTFANGAPVESMLPGPMTLECLDRKVLIERHRAGDRSARQIEARGPQIATMVSRHLKGGKAMIDTVAAA